MDVTPLPWARYNPLVPSLTVAPAAQPTIKLFIFIFSGMVYENRKRLEYEEINGETPEHVGHVFPNVWSYLRSLARKNIVQLFGSMGMEATAGAAKELQRTAANIGQ